MAQREGSINVGPIGLDVTLRIGELQNTLEQLTQALTGPVDMMGDKVAEAVSKFRDAGVSDLRQDFECCQRGDESCCHEDSRDLFTRITSQLKAAADKGAQEARHLLDEIGQGVESAGQTMQETAAPEEQQTHRPPS